MTTSAERVRAARNALLLAAACQRHEIKLPEPLKHLARRAFRHGDDPGWWGLRDWEAAQTTPPLMLGKELPPLLAACKATKKRKAKP